MTSPYVHFSKEEQARVKLLRMVRSDPHYYLLSAKELIFLIGGDDVSFHKKITEVLNNTKNYEKTKI